MGHILSRCCPLRQPMVVSDVFPYFPLPKTEEPDNRRAISSLKAQVEHLSMQFDNQKFNTTQMDQFNLLEGKIEALKFRIDCIESKNKFQDLLSKTPVDTYKLPKVSTAHQSVSSTSDSDDELTNARIRHPLIEMSNTHHYEPPDL